MKEKLYCDWCGVKFTGPDPIYKNVHQWCWDRNKDAIEEARNREERVEDKEFDLEKYKNHWPWAHWENDLIIKEVERLLALEMRWNQLQLALEQKTKEIAKLQEEVKRWKPRPKRVL